MNYDWEKDPYYKFFKWLRIEKIPLPIFNVLLFGTIILLLLLMLPGVIIMYFKDPEHFKKVWKASQGP